LPGSARAAGGGIKGRSPSRRGIRPRLTVRADLSSSNPISWRLRTGSRTLPKRGPIASGKRDANQGPLPKAGVSRARQESRSDLFSNESRSSPILEWDREKLASPLRLMATDFRAISCGFPKHHGCSRTSSRFPSRPFPAGSSGLPFAVGRGLGRFVEERTFGLP